MDVFLEYLVCKKSTFKDGLKKLGLVLATIVACYVVIVIFNMLGSFMSSLTLLGIAGVVYGTVVLSRNFSIEYEYIFTNGDLDIDVIKAQRTRKRLTSLQCKHIHIMASDKNEMFKKDFESEAIFKRYNAVYNVAAGGIYHILYQLDGQQFLLSFQPPKKLLAAMYKMNPRCVHIDPEDKEPEAEQET